MKQEKMNCTQKLVSLISGYDGGGNGTKDQGFYDCTNSRDKLHYLIDCVLASDDITEKADIFAALEFLNKEWTGEDKLYHAFMELEQIEKARTK